MSAHSSHQQDNIIASDALKILVEYRKFLSASPKRVIASFIKSFYIKAVWSKSFSQSEQEEWDQKRFVETHSTDIYCKKIISFVQEHI